MSPVNNFFKQIFKNSWQDFGIVIVLNTILGLLIAFYEINFLVEISFMLLMLYRSFLLHIEYSVMPGSTHDFSWKYLQALPLSKKQLLFTLSFGEFLTYLGLVTWVVAFYPQVRQLFTDDKVISLNTFFLQMGWLLLSIYSFCLFSIKNQIEIPRKQYSAQEPKTKYYFYLKNLVVGTTLLLYTFVVFRFWGAHSDHGIENDIRIFFQTSFDLLKSWWMIPILFALLVRNYFRLLNIWQNEKLSYKNQKWVHKIQIPQIVGSFALFAFGLFYFDFNTELLFAGDKVLSAVSQNDYKYLESQKIDPHYKSKFNVSPIYAAAYNGDYEMFKYLGMRNLKLTLDEVNRRGSNYKDTNIIHAAIVGGNVKILEYLLNSKLDIHKKPNTGLTYLQYAAKNCHPQMVELLLEKGFNIDEVNKNGNTALHIAARENCFSAAVALIESGADQRIKNKDGKVAIELSKGSRNKHLAYYFEKKLRAPASKK